MWQVCGLVVLWKKISTVRPSQIVAVLVTVETLP